MAKILPKVYVNRINKTIKNNNNIFYSAKPQEFVNEYIKEERIKNNNLPDIDSTVETKINRMFSSPSYVYKMDVQIMTKDGKKLYKQIIGKIDNKLITIDEEYILLNDIKDIKY